MLGLFVFSCFVGGVVCVVGNRVNASTWPIFVPARCTTVKSNDCSVSDHLARRPVFACVVISRRALWSVMMVNLLLCR